jgi:hypothetical protein
LAQKQYSVPLGGKKGDVVVASGSDISTYAVRVIIDDTNTPSKAQALEALDAARQRITEGTWPPA